MPQCIPLLCLIGDANRATRCNAHFGDATRDDYVCLLQSIAGTFASSCILLDDVPMACDDICSIHNVDNLAGPYYKVVGARASGRCTSGL